MSGADRDLERIEELEAGVARLETALTSANQCIADLRVQCAFWRRAAKDAVEGWITLEDKVDSAVQKITSRDPMRWCDVQDALGMLVEVDPLEPPDNLEAVTRELPPIDLGDGEKLRVIEDETPIAHAGIVGPTEK